MPHEQIREDNTQEVLLATLKLFSKYGVERTTFAQVAKLANVSIRSVYRYFNSKDALVSATVCFAVYQIEDEVRKLIHDIKYQELNGIDQILYLCQKMLDIARDNCKIQVSLNEAESYLSRLKIRDIFSLYNHSDNIIIKYFMEAFQKGIDDGTINENIVKEDHCFIFLAVNFRGFYNRIATIYANEELKNHYHPELLIQDYLQYIERIISSRWQEVRKNHYEGGK